MRQLIIFSLISLSIGCGPTTKPNAKSSFLDGTWVPVKQEMSGVLLPNEAFEKQKLIINDSSYIFSAESIDKGLVKYSGDKMDIYGKEGINTGKHFRAIYKYDNEQLTICYNLSGDSYPETFETKGKPLFFLSIFKKE